MNHTTKQHSALAAVAVVSLAIYVLACTSFSPDDSKVLFPAVDPKSGDLGVAVYDRKGGGIEQVFVASRVNPGEDQKSELMLLRPRWLPDGKSILVVWSGLKDEGLNIALIPYARRGPTRVYSIPEVKDSPALSPKPLSVAGSRLFLNVANNQLVRLDLETGKLRTHTYSGEKLTLLGSPNGDRVYYATEAKEGSDGGEIGTLDPETFAKMPITKIKADDTTDDGIIAMSPDGRRIAFLAPDKNKLNVFFTRGASGEKRLSLEMPFEAFMLGNGCLAPRHDIIYAAYIGEQKGKSSLGLLEVRLDGGPVRCVPLITGLEGADEKMVMYFQVALSHDGKTAAFCSTYLGDEKLTKDDVALFLVDLTSADRKVKKIPLPIYSKGKRESAKPL